MLEEVDFAAAMGADQSAHVFNQADSLCLGQLDEIDALAHVRKGNFLRCGDHDALGIRNGLEDGHMLVACSWRGVDDQEIKIAPGNVADELADGAGLLGSAPHNGLVTVGTEQRVHGNDFQAVLAGGRNDEVIVVNLQGIVFDAQKIGDARPVNVNVKQAYLVAQLD